MATKVAPKKRAGRGKPPVKKAAARKPAAKSAAKLGRPASKPTARKTAARTPAKKTAAKKTAPKTSGVGRGGHKRELDENGYVPGTDSAKIAELLLKGGADRNDINAKVEKAIGSETRNGTARNVPALVSGILNSLLEQGYKVESSFQVVAPARKRRRK